MALQSGTAKHATLTAYAAGLAGTRSTIEALGFTDYADLIIAIAETGLSSPVEEAGRIQSADAVMDAVRQAGRHPPRRDLWHHHDPEVCDAVRAVIAKVHDDEVPKRLEP